MLKNDFKTPAKIHASEDKRLIPFSKRKHLVQKWLLLEVTIFKTIKITTTTIMTTLMQAMQTTQFKMGMPPVLLRPAEPQLALEPPISTSGLNRTRFRSFTEPKARIPSRWFHQTIGRFGKNQSMDGCPNILPLCQCTPQYSSWMAFLSGWLGRWRTWPTPVVRFQRRFQTGIHSPDEQTNGLSWKGWPTWRWSHQKQQTNCSRESPVPPE